MMRILSMKAILITDQISQKDSDDYFTMLVLK